MLLLIIPYLHIDTYNSLAGRGEDKGEENTTTYLSLASKQM